MKITLLLALCLGLILCKDKLTTENKKIDVVGEASNTDSKPVVAVSYGVASNNHYSLRDDTGFMKPEIVSKLAEVILPPRPGPVEAVDEVIFNFDILDSDYY